MGYESARDRYRTDGAGVVSQPRLLCMVYDRLVLDLERADDALSNGRLDVASEKLCNAQSILLELHAALDTGAWEGAAGLSQLYLWFNNELMQANVNKDITRVRMCLRMIRELQQAWQDAYDSTLTSRSSTPVGAAPAAPGV